MTTALDIARIIHYDLSVANASAWQWWLAVSKYDYKDGLIFTNYGVNGTYQSIIQSKSLWALGNYSRYIRPGSQRIDCNGANDRYGLMASAYVDSSTSKIIAVLINASSGSKQIKLNFSGLDSSQEINYLTPYVTSSNTDDNLRRHSTFSVDSVYTVPAKSVVTIVGMLDGSAITDVEKTNEIPKGYSLNQNYPNPFNPTTKIKYKIPESDFVSIKVFNSLGEQIALLVNQEQMPGEHVTEFYASSLASGVYIYRLETENNSLSRKMILLK